MCRGKENLCATHFVTIRGQARRRGGLFAAVTINVDRMSWLDETGILLRRREGESAKISSERDFDLFGIIRACQRRRQRSNTEMCYF